MKDRKEYMRKYYHEHKQRLKQYYLENIDKIKQYRKEYYEKNKEICRIKRRIYYLEIEKPKKEAKPKKILERKIIAEYIILHKEEIEEIKKQRRKEKTKVYQMLYFQNNKDKIYKKRGITKC